MNLWTFLTIAVIVWAIVEVITTKKKNKGADISKDELKDIQDRLDRSEKRLRNLEAIVTEDADIPGSQTQSYESADNTKTNSYSSGRVTNRLK